MNRLLPLTLGLALLPGVSPVLTQAGTPEAVSTPQQQVRLVYGSGDAAEAARSVSVLYRATGGALSTGLGVRVHFNSELVQLNAVENLLELASLGVQVLPDSADLDADASTDSFIMAAWADLLGEWPGAHDGEVELFTIAYDALPGLERSLFTLMPGATAVGFEFAVRQGE